MVEKPELLTALYKRIVMLELPDKVFVNNHSRFVYEYIQYDTLKKYLIPYVDHMERSEECKYACKIGSLEITPKDMELGNLK